MKIRRRKARVVKIGGLGIGSGYPVAIQSMTKTKTAVVKETIRQAKQLESAGCQILRLSIRDAADAAALKSIKRAVSIPLVADIHFNWRLAIAAIENGADKIRLNPGNIYRKDEIRNIVSALKPAGIPLRVGVNSGSVRGLALRKVSMPDKLVKSAMDYIKTLEALKFNDIVVSLKASNCLDTVEAYRKIARLCDFPLHLGVTATGPSYQGIIKSSIAISALLLEGIGDTIRVSLTDEPQAEVKVAKSILETLGMRSFGPEIVSCPTCGRCEVDLIRIVKELEGRLALVDRPLSAKTVKLAVMGCLVNGPGEAKEADFGVAFGSKQGLLFRKGKAVRKVPQAKCADVLAEEVARLCSGQRP